MHKTNVSPEKEAALITIRDQFIGTTCASQCERLLEALHRFPVSTFEASRFLDVYDCPARVHQLRKAGHQIDTFWQTVVTEAGVKHRVGQYAMRRGADHAG